MRSAKVGAIYSQASSEFNHFPRRLLFSFNATWKLVEVDGQYGIRFRLFDDKGLSPTLSLFL